VASRSDFRLVAWVCTPLLPDFIAVYLFFTWRGNTQLYAIAADTDHSDGYMAAWNYD
jgi:hypothetical protein